MHAVCMNAAARSTSITFRLTVILRNSASSKDVIATWKADQFDPDALMDLYKKFRG